MHKRLSFLAAIVFSGLVGHAQLSMSLLNPPSGIVQKNQLWNMTLVYSGNNPVDITIGMSLLDAGNNQPLMTAWSSPLTLTKGVKMIKAADLAPLEYQYFSTAFDISHMPDAFLPIGNYRVCYTVYTGSKISAAVLAEDCISLEVQPLSPPQLNMPQDSGVMETPYPRFSWIPPAPVTLFNDLNYDLVVVEVMPGQTAGSALQENLPVYNQQHLTSIFSDYAASAKSLETGKIYAWKIVAKNGEQFAAQSEVWTFRIGEKKPESLSPANGMYLELKSAGGFVSTGTIPDNILGLKYYSYDKTHETTIRFLDAKGTVIREVKKMVDYGNNFMVFKLDRQFDKETTYYVELQDLQQTRFTTSFRMSK